jgi:AraC-like DNA-binding protein
MYHVQYTTERGKELLPLYVITVGDENRQPAVKRPEGAAFHHILFVQKGEVRFETAQGCCVVGEGSAVFFRKAYPMSYVPVSDKPLTGWITFDGACVDRLLTYLQAGDFCVRSGDDLLLLLRKCVHAVKRNASAETLSGIAYELILAFFDRSERLPQNETLKLAKAYIDRHYMRDISIAEVARAVEISESLLYRLFRAQGITPVAYLRGVRLERAKRCLLEEPTLSIVNVAERCGFRDCAYFCKVFRDTEHVTPKSYRKRYMM